MDEIGPLEGWLPGRVDVGLPLVRTPNRSVVLGPLEVIPGGLVARVVAASRLPMDPAEALGISRLGVEFEDGSSWDSAVRVGRAGAYGATPSVRVLSTCRLHEQTVVRLWLEPLPEVGDVTLTIEIADGGPTTVALDGEAIRAAAAAAEQLWLPPSAAERAAFLAGRRPDGPAETWMLHLGEDGPPHEG